MARTNYIFIDTEKVHEKDLSRVKNKAAIVNLVLGAKQQAPSIEIDRQLRQLGEKAGVTRTPTAGRNALDFVLTCELGMQAAKDPGGYFHIISKDKGFDVIVKYLRDRGILAARRDSLAEVPALMSTEERFVKLLADLDNPESIRPKNRKTLASTIQQAFNRELTEEVVGKAIGYLIRQRILEISETGKVIYAR